MKRILLAIVTVVLGAAFYGCDHQKDANASHHQEFSLSSKLTAALKRNTDRLNLGMSEEQVIQILGVPNVRYTASPKAPDRPTSSPRIFEYFIHKADINSSHSGDSELRLGFDVNGRLVSVRPVNLPGFKAMPANN